MSEQTPVHEHHNPDLLRIIPTEAKSIVEVGCSSGALAREYRKINPEVFYLGVEIEPEYARLAERHCDKVMVLDVDQAPDSFFSENAACDCWIFGDTLEHFRDPWQVLGKIRRFIPINGCIVACVPNAQHWSVQARLNCGIFRYEESGLMDRTHLRWFTRITLLELFSTTGFTVTEGFPRIFDEPNRDRFIQVIKQMASLQGADPEQAAYDSTALQYVIRAIPSGTLSETRDKSDRICTADQVDRQEPNR